jgi:hypothetical protein
MSQKWQLQASYQWEKSEGYSTGATTSAQSGPGTFGSDPNQLVNAYGRFPTDSAHSIRISSTVELPHHIQLAIRSVYESGRPYGRLITARGLAQGTVNVLAQSRDTFELPARNDLGIRVGKDFTIGPRVLRLSLDVQNLFNSDTPGASTTTAHIRRRTPVDSDFPAAARDSGRALQLLTRLTLCHTTNNLATVATLAWIARSLGAIS